MTRLREIYIQPPAETTEADIAEAMHILETLGAHEYTTQQAQHWVDKAVGALTALNLPAAKLEALQDLSDLMIKRVK